MANDKNSVRRRNLQKLAEHLGGTNALARYLNKSPCQISHLLSKNPCKNIGDKLATYAEQQFHLPVGWLDRVEYAYVESEVIPFYNNTTKIVLPVLKGSEVKKWVMKPKLENFILQERTITVMVNVSRFAFAYKIDNELMESLEGPSLPRGTIVIVEPEHILSNGVIVLVCVGKEKSPICRQLVKEGSRRFLKPLNPRYPISELIAPHYEICGIVKQALLPIIS